MTTAYAPPKRTRSRVLVELALAEARVASLQRDPRSQDPDSSCSMALDWYLARVCHLRLSLTDPSLTDGETPWTRPHP